MSLLDICKAILNLCLLLFMIFILAPFMLSVSEYFDKKIMKIVWNKKMKYRAKRNKRSK